MNKLSILCLAEERLPAAQQCAAALGLSVADERDAEYALVFGAKDVHLHSLLGQHGDLRVDFCGGSAAHRRKFGGGKGQLIAKAVGVKSGVRPPVWDMTAGLGGDGFVLASLGCAVTLFERHPVAYALLADGLARAKQFAREEDSELEEILDRMELVAGDAIARLHASSKKVPVIYLDPMFPVRTKSARVKKDMQAFHRLIGDDADAAELLQVALLKADNRVVVKRPRNAPSVADREPSYRLEGKSSRYDIYALKSLT